VSGYPQRMDPQPENHPSTSSGIPGMPDLDDLPAKGADAVDSVIAFIQDKAVRPLTLATRAIVFGIIVFAAAIVTITLLTITLIRFLTVYIPGNRVWVSDLIVGVVFVVGGILAWSQRIDRSAGSGSPA